MDNFYDNIRLLITARFSRRKRPRRDAVGKSEIMENLPELPVKKELIVKRISASKFEVYDASEPPGEKPEAKQEGETPAVMARESVIQRAPPAPREDSPPSKKKRGESFAGEAAPGGVILIKDAIMYRIVDILLWKVMGEAQLRDFGYPVASTCQVLWRAVCHNHQNMGATKPQQEYFNKDHDCGGNVACFANHVYRFLEMCAPNLWKKTGWGRLPVEELLRRLYYEDLIPYLRSVELKNNINVLQCHSDIVLLEKWEKQKFTAVTWTGQKYFSQLSVNCPKCPQCSNRHF